MAITRARLSLASVVQLRWTHDKKKDLAFTYDFKGLSITKSSTLRQKHSEFNNDDMYDKYWRQYYETQYIPEKKNLKLALKNFPKKYWNDSFEADFLRKHLE
ncbi:MAG: DUF4130 domain-containing protein [Bacillota bacterium]